MTYTLQIQVNGKNVAKRYVDWHRAVNDMLNVIPKILPPGFPTQFGLDSLTPADKPRSYWCYASDRPPFVLAIIPDQAGADEN